jgi:hypothetical protein
MSDTAADDGEYIVRDCPLLFRCGDYPDKNFSLSPEEALETVAEFAPVDIDLEHKPTIFNGQLGQVHEVDLHQNGWDIKARARIPKWLDRILPPEARKLSAAFDRKTKRIIGVSLVRNPRVGDAAMMAAFAAAHPEIGVEYERRARAAVSDPASFAKDSGLSEHKLAAFKSEAVSFAAGLVTSSFILPSAQAGVADLYCQAMIDDYKLDEPVKFGDEWVTRTEALRRSYKHSRPHGLTQEQIRHAESAQALFNSSSAPAHGSVPRVPADRRRELLAMTDIGRTMLSSEKNGN